MIEAVSTEPGMPHWIACLDRLLTRDVDHGLASSRYARFCDRGHSAAVVVVSAHRHRRKSTADRQRWPAAADASRRCGHAYDGREVSVGRYRRAFGTT